MTVFAWPAAVVVIAVIFMVVFRKPIGNFLDRAKKIGTTGIEATASAQETSIERTRSGADELLARFENSLLIEREEGIREELNSKRVDDPADREKVLIRHLAASITYANFERTYNNIFGSQIRFLQELNAEGTMQMCNAQIYYNLATTMEPEFYANYSFEQWLNFMASYTLVRVDGGPLLASQLLAESF